MVKCLWKLKKNKCQFKIELYLKVYIYKFIMSFELEIRLKITPQFQKNNIFSISLLNLVCEALFHLLMNIDFKDHLFNVL